MIKMNNNKQLTMLHNGFYSIEHDHYLTIPAISNSAINNRIKYPHGVLNINKETDSMRLGKLFHELILEPTQFYKKNYLMRAGDKRTKRYKEMIETARKYGKNPIDVKEWTALQHMKKLVRKSIKAQQLISSPYKEVTAIFEYQGQKCKCRFDACAFKDGYALISDLKTISTLDPQKLRWHCRDFGYHRQAAFYSLAMKSLMPEYTPLFVNIFVETPTDTKYAIGCKCAAFKEETLLEAENEIDEVIMGWNDPERILDLEI